MTQSTESTIEKTKDAIEETRDRVRERVNNMQDELSASALLDRFAPRGQPLSESIRKVSDAAKRNPVATALLAGGAMLLGREVLAGSNGRIATYADEKDAAARVGKHVESVKEAATDMAESASEVTETAKRKALKGVDAASDTAEELLRSGRQQADLAYRSANRAVRAGTTDAAKAASTGKRWVEDNPVAAGLACVAVGALAASFFTAKPISDYREDDHDDDHDRPATKATKIKSGASRSTAVRKPAVPKSTKAKQVKRKVNTSGAKTVKTGVKTSSSASSSSARSIKPAGTTSPTDIANRTDGYTRLPS
ncbi:MAG: hypothetical protein HKP56_17810 [Anderseniella sp.]|nr:hypothetical protein [Anderseniella sp.]